MRKAATLITGANGEIGHGLIEHFSRDGDHEIVALDLKPLDASLEKHCTAHIVGDILDENLLQRLVSEFEIQTVYHLAALLSTRAEYTPDTAHRVNVEGTHNLLKLAHEQARWHGHPVKFLFPSSIAVYGLPDRRTKDAVGPLKEKTWNLPVTMYGCSKIYCEHIGRYYSRHYRQLAAERSRAGVDFRAIRLPGLISAVTTPSGGTSDYGSEMIHAAARGNPYACFVAPETQLPFMAMPDAVKALVTLAAADRERLTQSVYNITAFSVTAAEIRDRVLSRFPNARITFEPDAPRAAIVDTWPADVDDTPARNDWDWQPEHDADAAFNDYLFPAVTQYYKSR